MADRRMFPSAAAVKTGKYTVWVRLQGADADFFICVLRREVVGWHVPGGGFDVS